jgi:hypothetical protein
MLSVYEGKLAFSLFIFLFFTLILLLVIIPAFINWLSKKKLKVELFFYNSNEDAEEDSFEVFLLKGNMEINKDSYRAVFSKARLNYSGFSNFVKRFVELTGGYEKEEFSNQVIHHNLLLTYRGNTIDYLPYEYTRSSVYAHSTIGRYNTRLKYWLFWPHRYRECTRTERVKGSIENIVYLKLCWWGSIRLKCIWHRYLPQKDYGAYLGIVMLIFTPLFSVLIALITSL